MARLSMLDMEEVSWITGAKKGKIAEMFAMPKTQQLWLEENVDIADCYLVGCLEKDNQNFLYSYDRDINQFKVNRKAS